MNTILFDISATQPKPASRYHGGGEYGRAVLYRLLESIPLGAVHGVYHPESLQDQEIAALCRSYGVTLHPTETHAEISAVIKRTGADVFYTALPYNYAGLDLCGARLVCTFHGLRKLEMPTDIYERHYLRGPSQHLRWWLKHYTLAGAYRRRMHRKYGAFLQYARSEGARIVVPSLHTKYSIVAHYPDFNADEITVLYSPLQLPAAAAPEDVRSLGVEPGGYILLISGNRWIKNAYRAIEALAEIVRERPEFPYRILTAGVDNPAIFSALNLPQENFVFCDYLQPELLQALYRDAAALLYPTLNEGFGYPPLQAALHGTPVLCSAVSSLTEVWQDSVTYFDPHSVGEIKMRLLQFWLDREAPDARVRLKRRAAAVQRQQELMLDELVEIIAGERTVAVPSVV